MFKETIIIFLLLGSHFTIKAQIWPNWHDRLFELSAQSPEFDFLQSKIKKNHIERIQLYYINLRIDSVAQGKRVYRKDTDLVQTNSYKNDGILLANITYDPWPIKTGETRVSHPDKFTIEFASINFHKNGTIDTIKTVNTKNSKNENVHYIYKKDTLWRKEIIRESGDTSYRLVFDSDPVKPRIKVIGLNQTGKFYHLKQSIWNSGAYTINIRKLKIYHHIDYPQIDETRITETINKRHSRVWVFGLDKDGTVVRNYTTDYYYFADGRIQRIELGEGFEILFFYNKNKMLVGINYNDPAGNLIEGNFYKYAYR